MSFSQQVKREICEREFLSPCCATAGSYGFACFAKKLNKTGMLLQAEKLFIPQQAQKVFRQAGICGETCERSHGYNFVVEESHEIDKMLAMFGYSGDETALRLHADLFLCGSCFSSFVAAAFLASGTIVDPDKGYSLEFVSSRFNLMKDFANLLAQHGFSMSQTRRKGVNVLYARSSETIEDLLTLMGATQSSIEIMQRKITKDVRNRANRITNCETANIDKIVAANRQIFEAIQILEKYKALDTLPEPLRLAIDLRRANPDVSLSELAALSPEPISKSGLSHRYRKICQRAAELEAAKKPH